MSLFLLGRLCIKLAGRDAGQKCVVVDSLSERYVLVDGATRRKKVNVKHLEPLAEMIEIKEKASSAEVRQAFQKLGLETWEKKSKKISARPKKQKVKKEEQEQLITAVKKKEEKTEAKA